MGPLAAFDLATRTGWAVRRADGGVIGGSYLIADSGTPLGPFLTKFERWLVDFLARHQPAAVAYEQPFVRQMNTTSKLHGLAALVEMAAWKRGIPAKAVTTQEAAKALTGYGGGKGPDKKARVAAACQARGWAPSTQDEADALAVLEALRLDLGGRAVPVGPMFVNRKVVT